MLPIFDKHTAVALNATGQALHDHVFPWQQVDAFRLQIGPLRVAKTCMQILDAVDRLDRCGQLHHIVQPRINSKATGAPSKKSLKAQEARIVGVLEIPTIAGAAAAAAVAAVEGIQRTQQGGYGVHKHCRICVKTFGQCLESRHLTRDCQFAYSVEPIAVLATRDSSLAESADMSSAVVALQPSPPPATLQPLERKGRGKRLRDDSLGI